MIVGLPHIIVVDDSEALLAFARAALSAHYTVSTANDGTAGLRLIERVMPQLVLLDLSMPGMNGEELLAHLKASPELEPIPVVIISSEQRRAEACLAKGATAHLIKPLRADDLVATVGRALESARARAARGSFAVLPLTVGPLALAVPLIEVRQVVLQPAVEPLPGAPSYLTGFFELFGDPVCVLDLAARFGVAHAQPVAERKLVVVERDAVRIALCADDVHDPEDIPPADIYRATADADQIEIAVVKTVRGSVPVIRPLALISLGIVRSLSELAKRAAAR